MKKIGLLCFLLLGFGAILMAQNLQEDLKKMQESYAEMTSFGTDITVKMYEADQLIMTKKAAIKKDHSKCLYRLDQVKMLVNDRYSLLVNEEEKVIVLQDIKGKQKGFPDRWEGLNPEQMEKFLAAYDDWDFMGKEKGQLHFQLFDQKGMIKQIDLYLQAEDYTLRKLIYNYNEAHTKVKNKVVITYGGFKINPEWPEATFSEKQFVQKRKGSWMPNPAYSDYELIEPVQPGE